jgi:autotransporter-associated beta strand protein
MRMSSSSQGRVLVRAYTIVALALLAALSVSPARAATYTWDIAAGAGITGGPGTWGVNNFWTQDGTTLQAWVPGEDAVFDLANAATAQPAITVSGVQSVSSLSATRTAGSQTRYNISSGTISFTGNGLISTDTVNLNVASNITTTTGTLIKSGATLLYLSGAANQYTGAVVINGGGVQFLNGGAVTNPLGASSTLILNSGTFGALANAPAANISQTINGVTVGSGATVAVNAQGTGTVALTLGTISRNVGSGGMSFSIVDTAKQRINVSNGLSNGILGPWAMVGNNWATKDGNGDVVAYTGYTTFTGTQALPSDSTANAKFNLPSTGTFTLSSATTSINTLLANSGAATTITIGSGQVLRTSGIYGFNSATSVAVSGSGVLTALSSANPELVVRQAGQNVNFSATIADVDPTTPTTLTKLGVGNLFLSGPGTFTGATYLNEGGIYTQTANALQFSTLVMGGGNLFLTVAPILGGLSAASAGAGYDIALSKNLTVGNNNSSTTYAGVLSSTSNFVKVGTGTLTLSGSNTYTGTTAISAGVLRIGGAGRLIGTTGTYAGNVSVAAGSTFQYDSTAGSTLSGVISGSGGLVQSGAGKLTLLGANSYTGSTIISAGTLALGAGGSLAGSQTIIAGNAGSSGAVLDLSARAGAGNTFTFAAGQKVMGNGTIDLAGGTLRVPGMLAPGNSPGNLTINGNLAWQSSDAGYQWEINGATGIAGTNWDLLTVTGALDLTSLSGASTYLLDLTTLTSLNAAGPMANYVAGSSYTWSLVSASSVLLASGSAAAGTDITSLFNVSFANWANTAPSAGNYSVRVASDGQGINLVIVPEPNTIIFAGVGIAMAAWSLRKRRQK